ncbi:hypothetical protein [Streptomyces hilarionis]|uniref:hypothetical protein n=1 Tax=Streptomyces hilarionis TaxID=2839954 RepID=UPI00211A10D7|nr:hypothetical protein [Streptomyces hilarionis]
MTDHHGRPQQPNLPRQPRAEEIPLQAPPVQQAPAPAAPAAPALQAAPVAAPAPATAAAPAPVPQVFQAERAWVDGYEPGDPWQARLCVETPYGTFAYALTPNTIPELLEPMVLVAQEQQGLPVGFGEEREPEFAEGADEDEGQQAPVAGIHGGRAARLTGWAVVHDLWEREDPTARIVMGAIVVVLLLLGIVLT